MAAQTLRFGGTQIGDIALRVVSSTVAMTPPVVQTGVWRSAARIDSASRNVLHGLIVAVHIARSSESLCARAVAAVQSLLGTRGAVEVRSSLGGTIVRSDEDWVFMSAAAPEIMSGFGGRICTEWELTFAGGTAAQWYG